MLESFEYSTWRDVAPNADQRLSLIVPATGDIDAIEEHLLSVIHQSVPAHEVLTVIDRNTSGHVITMIRRLQRMHPSTLLRIIEYPADATAATACNAVIEAATGNILGFLRTNEPIDDVWIERVARLVAQGHESPDDRSTRDSNTGRQSEIAVDGCHAPRVGTVCDLMHGQADLAVTVDAWNALRPRSSSSSASATLSDRIRISQLPLPTPSRKRTLVATRRPLAGQ